MALFRLKKDSKTISSTDGIAPKGEGASASGKKTIPNVKKEIKKVEKKTTSSDILSLNYKKDTPSVLKHPRVTEKATIQSENGVYVFDVAPRATKKDVAEAVEALYKVTPRKINMARVPSKRVRVRGAQNKYGVKSGGKKAYVYVKKGDTIDIV